MKQLKRPTPQTFHWFPVEMVHIEPKLFKRVRFFLCCKKFFGGIQSMPYESWRPAVSENVMVFMISSFKPELLLLKVGSNLTIFFCKVAVLQKRHGYNFAFQASIWIDHASDTVLLRSYSCQKTKRKIVAVSFLLRRIIIVTNSKCQTPLTLSSHNSGLKKW